MNGRSILVPEKPLLDGNSLPKRGKRGLSSLSFFAFTFHCQTRCGITPLSALSAHPSLLTLVLIPVHRTPLLHDCAMVQDMQLTPQTLTQRPHQHRAKKTLSILPISSTHTDTRAHAPTHRENERVKTKAYF